MCPRQRTQQQRESNHDSWCQNTLQVPKIRKTGEFLAKLQMQSLWSSDWALSTVDVTEVTALRTPHGFARCCQSSSRTLGNQEDTKSKAQNTKAAQGAVSRQEPQLEPASSYLAAAEDVAQGHLHVEVLQHLQRLFLCLLRAVHRETPSFSHLGAQLQTRDTSEAERQGMWGCSDTLGLVWILSNAWS